jgi:hypothetical protein
MPAGRPSIFSPTLADTICERIASGETLSAICIDDDMPSVATVGRWTRENPEFKAAYAHARVAQAEVRQGEIITIADSSYSVVRLDDGTEKIVANDPQRDRLRIDARKWVAARFDPATYGDKQFVEHSGSIDLNLRDMSTEDLLAGIQQLMTLGFIPKGEFGVQDDDPNADLG